MEGATESGPNLVDLMVKPKTARAPGLTIPQSVLVRADEVVR